MFNELAAQIELLYNEFELYKSKKDDVENELDAMKNALKMLEEMARDM